MATAAKILIAVIFILSNVFLGFTVAAINNANDNPKYKFMREKWMREIIRFDCARLQQQIAVEVGTANEPGGNMKVAIDALNKSIAEKVANMKAKDAETKADMDSRDERLEELERIQIRVSNFTATVKAYREALASLERKYGNLQDSYQDTVRQFESLAVEKKRMQIEKSRITEDHRALEDQYFGSQKEAAELTEVIAMANRQNSDLDKLLRLNGRMVEGEVKSVARPPAGVVIISIGRNDGVSRGQHFSVFDAQGNFKAKVQIVEVMPNTSTGIVEYPYQNVEINQSDRVRRSAVYLSRDISNARDNNR